MSFTIPEQLRTLRQSDLGTMLSCGAKLWLSKVDGLARPASKKMLVGTAFHKGVECFYRALRDGDAIDVTEAKLAAVESIQTGFALADAEILDLEPGETVQTAVVSSGSLLVDALQHYAVNVFPEIAATGEPAAVEERFDIDYRGFHLHGTVDLIDGDAALRDHKFSGAYLSKDWPDSYLSQLGRYAWFLDVYGAPVLDIRLDMLSYAKATRKKDPVFESHTYDLSQAGIDMKTLVRLGKESVDQALDMIEAGIFPRAGANVFGLGCGFCPFKGAKCQEFRPTSPAAEAASPVRHVPTVAASA